jgi:peptidoglycan/xylan/chitin deacetylase (PgdA/CDA1 family)
MLFAALVNVSATEQTSSGFINSSTPTAASVNAPVIPAGVTSTSTAKKYVVFRDDDVYFGNLSALEAVDQVHIEENVPVTLAIIPHANPCGTGNEMLQDTSVTNYLLSIVHNPLFEFAQHGYNHYDYADNGPPNCSASSAEAGVPQVVGPAGPYHEVGESLGPGGRPVGATFASEFYGRPYADQYNAIKQGRNDMIQALGVAPTTFIPPFDSGDQNTLKAASALGFTLYSTGPGDFNVNDAILDGIMVQASASFGIGSWANDTAWQTGMSCLTAQTDAALNNATAGESVVVLYHFWAFENHDGSVNTAHIALFKQYIDHLKSRGDVSFSTLSDQPLMNPSPAPAVSLQDGNRLDVFAQGIYDALWNKHY